MICVKTNLKASLWLTLGYIFKIQKEAKIHAKSAKLYKKVMAFWAEKVVKSEVVAMKWLQ